MVWSIASVLILGALFLRVPGQYYFQELATDDLGDPVHEMVAYEEGPLATVAVIEDSVGDRTIYVDAVGVAGTDRILLTDQKSLAHVPMLILEDPKRALTVGFGSGGASWLARTRGARATCSKRRWRPGSVPWERTAGSLGPCRRLVWPT